MLISIISGMQTGSDIAAIKAAVKANIPTTGCMPRGWLTENGARPQYAELYNAYEHSSDKYSPRTWENVVKSDGTLFIVKNVHSAGTKTTLKAIEKYNRPYFIVNVKDTGSKVCNPLEHPEKVAAWIKENNIKILNVAGNRESVANGIEAWAEYYITKLIEIDSKG